VGRWSLLILILFMSLGSVAGAAEEVAQTFTLDGRLYQTSSTTPLTDPSVLLRIQVLDPSKSCVLYEETQTINTAATDGRFTVQVGSPTTGALAAKRSGGDPGNSMAMVFQNKTAPLVSGCGGYTPSAGDVRYFRIRVTPSSTGVASTLSPDMALNSVPSAMVAERAEAVGSVTAAQIATLVSGASTSYVQSTSSGATLPSFTSNPSSPSAGQIWFDSVGNSLKFFDGSAVKTVSVSGGALTEADIPTLSSAGKVSGSAITSGTIGGSTSLNTTGTISSGAITSSGAVNAASMTATGAVSAAAVSATSVSTNSLQIFRADNANKVTLQVPVTLSPNYTLTLPGDDGTNGQVLTTDGNGVLSWASILTAVSNNASLANGKIWVGDGAGKAQERTMSGDATISNTGAPTLATVPVSKGGTNATSFGNNKVITSNGTGTALTGTSCGLNQVISFDASGNITCQNVTALAAMFINGGNSFGGTATLGTNDGKDLAFETNGTTKMTIQSGGNVGIGTTAPTRPLDVAGNVAFGVSGSGANSMYFKSLQASGADVEFLRIQAQSPPTDNRSRWVCRTGNSASGTRRPGRTA
jgi:hypothetical protein